MTKSELIDHLAKLQPHLVHRDVELAVNAILRQMGNSLARGERIEVRGFGTFSVRRRRPRIGRNPRTGEMVEIPAKQVLHFKPGKDLRDRVDEESHPQILDIESDALEEQCMPPAENNPPKAVVQQDKDEEAARSRAPEMQSSKMSLDGRAGSE